MSAAGDLVARLAKEGIDPSLLSEVAEALFTGEIESRNLADRRKNERERKARSRDVTGQDVTSGDPSPFEVSPHTPLPKTPNQLAPLNPPKSGKRMIPADWTPPPPDQLTPRARACAFCWTDASYQTQAEGFLLYWRNERKMRPDWTATWANWVIRVHSQVMRDQKFGNAPIDLPASLTVEQQIDQLQRLLPRWEEAGRQAEAEDARRKISELERQLAA